MIIFKCCSIHNDNINSNNDKNKFLPYSLHNNCAIIPGDGRGHCKALERETPFIFHASGTGVAGGACSLTARAQYTGKSLRTLTGKPGLALNHVKSLQVSRGNQSGENDLSFTTAI